VRTRTHAEKTTKKQENKKEKQNKIAENRNTSELIPCRA